MISSGTSHSAVDSKKINYSKILVETLNQFFNKTSMHGFQYLIEKKRPTLERFMWMIVHGIASSSAIYLVLISWFSFTATPTFIALNTQQYPIKKVSFPGIAVCSVNKISKKRAETYSNYLFKRHTEVEQTVLFDKIRYLGRLYDSDIEGREEFMWFQDILDSIDVDNVTGLFNSDKTMKYLAPQCSEMLVKCLWAGKELSCTDEFKFHRTMDGYCCIFNHLRQLDFDGKTNQKTKSRFKMDDIGPNHGLIVVLNASSEDYYYPLMNFIGFSIIMFNPYDYPDSNSGNVFQQMVGPYQEILMPLDTHTLLATPIVEQFTLNQRGCLFTHELKGEYGGQYSYSDCLVKCRIRSIIALCRCLPFYLPVSFPDGNIAVTVKCTLQHVPCLNRYTNKWRTYRPRGRNIIRGLESELEDSLSCPNCLPLCTIVKYKSEIMQLPITLERMQNLEVLNDINNKENLSIIKIYTPDFDSSLFIKDSLYAWFEILSNFGGTLGLCIGCSIITLIEFIYFFTYHLSLNVNENKHINRGGVGKKRKHFNKNKINNKNILNNNKMMTEYKMKMMNSNKPIYLE